MGKKTSLFSAIKGIFTKHPSSSSSFTNNNRPEGDKKNKGTRLKHGFPKLLYREPSSIEKILEEVDQHNLFFPPRPPITTQPQPPPPPRVTASPPRTLTSPRVTASPPRTLTSPRVTASPPRTLTSPRVTASPPRTLTSPPPTTSSPRHPQATQKINLQPLPETKPQPESEPQPEPELEPEQEPEPTLPQHQLAANKIQAAYRRYKSRRNRLARLQGVANAQNVRRQTVNAMKQMQLLVRLQTQIHSRRIQMLNNQSLKPPSTNVSEMGDWDDSMITKEERDARSKKKVEAVTNRERAMSYAYSHQKATPKSGHEKDVRSRGYPPYPWWWNSLERQLPSSHTTQLPLKNHQLASTPSRLTPDQKQSHKQLDKPMSSRSSAPSRTRQQQTTPSSTPPNRMMMLKYPKSRPRGGGYPIKDDDSLMSCPPFTVPNYMSPTVSAKAKARPTSNPRDRVAPSTPGSVSSSVSKRRFSFPFTPNINKWNKNKSPASVGGFSVDSANSMPASLGRKPFNRFV